jgi:fructoselysine 6-kinase
MKIVALTVCCVDFYPQQGKSYLGGNSLNYAAQARLSAPDDKISVIAAVGTDEYGARINVFLKQNSISTTYLYHRKGDTASNQIMNDEYGERIGIPGEWKNGVYGSFLLSDEDWSFALSNDIIAMPANNPNFETLIQKKIQSHFIVSDFLDVENKIPIEKYINSTDIAQIAGRENLLGYYNDLAVKSGKLIIVTLGSLGSVVFHEGKSFRQEAIVVQHVIDTTGCGDSYLAAFSIEYYKSKNIKMAMNAGALAASYTLQHFGGVVE